MSEAMDLIYVTQDRDRWLTCGHGDERLEFHKMLFESSRLFLFH